MHVRANEWSKSGPNAAARLVQLHDLTAGNIGATTLTPTLSTIGAQTAASTTANTCIEDPSTVHDPVVSDVASSGDLNRTANVRVTSLMLDASYRNLPMPSDCEKAKPYLPPNPYRTMPYYPQHPHTVFSDPDVFQKLDVDTLFFIFYYQQATYQQHLAATELKRRSWRYHTQYLTWFQRQEKPREVTEAFEVGHYIYFDYESEWCARTKPDFTFTYDCLEDEQSPT